MENLYHIGRDEYQNEIYIHDDSVSKKHAQLLINQDADLFIIDLSSKNGVFVNDNKINIPTKLSKNDKIRIGNLSFKKEQLVNAIKTYEINKRANIDKNVPLISSVKPQNNKLKSPKYKFSKYNQVILVFSIVIIVIISIFSADYLLNQNKLRRLINNESTDILDDFQNNVNEIINDFDKGEKEEINKRLEKKKNDIPKNNKQSSEIIYDFSCLSEETGVNDLIYEFGDLTREVQNTMFSSIEISIEDEKKAGNEFVNEILKKKKNISRGKDYKKLNNILKDLTSRLVFPRGVNYEIFLIDDTIKNVFTLGGNIVFYKGMYDFCKSDSEIASIIAHEIAHNELGHSTLALKKQRLSSNFGILGEITLSVENFALTSFNQKQEIEADMFGMDLIYPSKYNTCSGVELWKRMSEKENEFNIAENLFRSHPYSKDRAKCLNNHLTKNYNIDCK
tara:strand:+ start:3248 stop:4597 length:1350 start_codon:yes stop_codon:yes gene_type:complete